MLDQTASALVGFLKPSYITLRSHWMAVGSRLTQSEDEAELVIRGTGGRLRTLEGDGEGLAPAH